MSLMPGQLPGSGVLRLRHPVEGIDDYCIVLHPATAIGRHPSNDLQLPRVSISRFHARILRDNGRFFVEDLGSSNGTFVNGMPITRLEIKNEDLVRFGDLDFSFFVDEETTDRGPKRSDTSIRFFRPTEAPTTEVVRTQHVANADQALAEISEIKSLSLASKYLKAHYRLLNIIRQRPGEERLFKSFLEMIFDVVSAERGVIMLIDPKSELKLAAVRFRDETRFHEEVRISQSITDKCISEKVAILSGDAKTDARFRAADSILVQSVTSAICVPLLMGQKVLGVCYLDTRMGRNAFNESDLAFVANLTSQLALALDNLRMTRERLQAEQLVVIGQTMTEVAHNIKNILLVTKGGAYMMEKSLEQGDVQNIRKIWDMVRRGMDRMNKMAHDMLNYSHLEQRKRVEVRLNDVAHEVYDSLRSEMENSTTRIVLETDPGLGSCWLNPEGLYDVLMNLVVNARDAIGDKKRGMIEIRTSTNSQGDSIVTVSDNGEGIPQSAMEKIFLPFYTTKGEQGTGMGLAMVKRFINEMGGHIDVLSEAGQGTTFTIAFPRKCSEDEIDM